ncbi:hypothetical protein M5X00_18820 [Paenibacillus alvei]|uniref:hypothetical protein n=1 Tax=Paenibacillus alvei TaxID=44250 RepID=UPI000289BC96|nr:hypothetical protein [Paenibacillus alvei]EJW15701.1 hypothetical protein PAV_7c00740 [Paenibacillus alvei DSM 29]MCY9545275.1 hypothetical protein [Paenibacillus alvei]MCY9707477.1 hypothetical protein [Paenibacillus alvei]MCY9734121.1 hypothetical protein [Paenibacillus alvei]MCY9756298.1 hypothetical protein [Paenibacillus alvei]
MYHASRMVELAVASILLVVALAVALQMIGSTSSVIRQVDSANQDKDRSVRATIDPIRSKSITGTDVILFIGQLRTNVELVVEGLRFTSPIHLDQIQLDAISRTKRYELSVERNEGGDIRKMIFR